MSQRPREMTSVTGDHISCWPRRCSGQWCNCKHLHSALMVAVKPSSSSSSAPARMCVRVCSSDNLLPRRSSGASYLVVVASPMCQPAVRGASVCERKRRRRRRRRQAIRTRLTARPSTATTSSSARGGG